MGLSVEEILSATGGRLIAGDRKTRLEGVSTDTRNIKAGEIFIAIKGEIYDGHDFVEDAIKKGACGAIVSGQPKDVNFKAQFVVIQVKDTIKVLGAIAAFHRKKFDIPVIGITGSNGKTTTKDMVAAVLETKFRTLKNPSTENNAIGLPLTLLKLDKIHQACVLEMGTNHFGEIEYLSKIASPDIGVIINIGPAHLEFFKDLDGVRKAKCELFKSLKRNATAVVNGEDFKLVDTARRFVNNVVTFGVGTNFDFCANDISMQLNSLEFTVNSSYRFRIPVTGMVNVYNALCAIAIGRLFEIEFARMAEVLNKFEAPAMRMQVKTFSDITFIDDSYNANPVSMEYAIETLKVLKSNGRKVLICADMLELGNMAQNLHSKIGALAAKAKIDLLITVGLLSKTTNASALENGMERNRLFHFADFKEAAKNLSGLLRSGDLVLVKGSRRMRMEEVIRCFTSSYIH